VVRRILEQPIARLTAQHASEEQRARIAELASSFDEDMTLREFRRLDREFHLAIAAACGNQLLAELCAKVMDRLFSSDEFEAMLTAVENKSAVQDVIASSSKAHRRVAEAVLAHDVAASEDEIASHLNDVEDRMIARMD
jgi:GntR family transcriptional repressor for pyruvate dehydrogenase complex